MVVSRPLKSADRSPLVRCGLHPRWNRTRDQICFDALETANWTRQLHVAQLDLPR